MYSTLHIAVTTFGALLAAFSIGGVLGLCLGWASSALDRRSSSLTRGGRS